MLLTGCTCAEAIRPALTCERVSNWPKGDFMLNPDDSVLIDIEENNGRSFNWVSEANIVSVLVEYSDSKIHAVTFCWR